MIECEDFHTNDRRRRQAGSVEVGDRGIEWPTLVALRSDHRKHRMSGWGVERAGFRDDQSRATFGLALVGERERNNDDVEGVNLHSSPIVVARASR